MQLIDINNTTDHKPLVATIGFFDGVHVGHRYLIEQVKAEAKKKGLPSAVITFSVHPRKVLQSDYQPALLCGLEEKLDRLASTGIDYCVVLEFTKEMSELSAAQFMDDILRKQLMVESLLIGYDHRFGYDRKDDFADYQRYGHDLNIDIIKAKEYPNQYVSSSYIRGLLGKGKVEEASQLLSYNYTISGKIIHGFQIGRTIGFPTANMQIWERYKVIPALGVYAVYAYVGDDRYRAMLYIGKRPTLHQEQDISIEVNLFDFDDDLYNKELTVEFLRFVRSDKKFSGIEALKKQISDDKGQVISFIYKYESSLKTL